MRTIKILIVLAVLLGFIILVYVLLTPGVSTISQAPSQTAVSGGQTITDMNSEECAVIDEYVQAFGNGWNDTLYQNAGSYISHPARMSDVEQMHDRLVSGILLKLDSIINHEFTSGLPQTDSRRHQVLRSSYRGLESLARDFPVVARRGIYERLMEDRDVLDGIYAFSVSTFSKSPCFNLRLVPSASGYSLDWNETLADYASMRRQYDTRRRNLQDRLARCGDLTEVQWLQPTLAERRFLDRMTTAEATYKNAERGQFLATLRSLPSDPRLSNDQAAAHAVAEQLTALEANLPSMLYSDEASRAFASVRSRLNNVTAGPQTR